MSVLAAGDTIDLKSGWATIWDAAAGSIGPLSKLLTTVGVLLVVAAIGKWLWERRRGVGGSSSGLLWTLALGATLAAPNLLIPVFLMILDALANTVINAVPK